MKTLRSEMDMPNKTHFTTSTVEVSSDFQISVQTTFSEDLHTGTESIPRVSIDPLPRFCGFFIRPTLRFNAHRSDMRAAV
jgi:hypothetical protein